VFADAHDPSLPGCPRVEEKYSCWKNDKGEVEITKWTEPPAMYQYWHAHGVKHPRNKKTRMSFTEYSFFVILTLLFYFIGWLVPLTVAWILQYVGILGPDYFPLVIILLCGALGVAIGGFFTHFGLHNSLEAETSLAWARNETEMDFRKKTKVSTSPKPARAT